jgi:hypothetical protein
MTDTPGVATGALVAARPRLPGAASARASTTGAVTATSDSRASVRAFAWCIFERATAQYGAALSAHAGRTNKEASRRIGDWPR